MITIMIFLLPAGNRWTRCASRDQLLAKIAQLEGKNQKPAKKKKGAADHRARVPCLGVRVRPARVRVCVLLLLLRGGQGQGDVGPAYVAPAHQRAAHARPCYTRSG